MHILAARTGKKIELDLVRAVAAPRIRARRAIIADAEVEPLTETPLSRATRAVFELGSRTEKSGPRAKEKPAEPPPAVFRERDSGLVRTVFREIVVRFAAGTSTARRASILRKVKFSTRRTNVFVDSQVVIHDPARRHFGTDLLPVANALAELDEVVFATPNFVSQYRRAVTRRISDEQWHLENRAAYVGQLADEDVDARKAWRVTAGKPSIVIAVIDDGVDIDHPALRSRLWTGKGVAREKPGRDFVLADDDPDHYNARPKQFIPPFDDTDRNDIHGTCCAGVALAAGPRAWGIAPGCRLLPIKIFRGSDLAEDERVADAIRYAARKADILSCSWSGSYSADIDLAVEDAGRLGRGGKGTAVFCATGNENRRVGHPATSPGAIAVGACTDKGRRASYSNKGREIDIVAPSSGGALDIFTTDVSLPGRGYNTGEADLGGADGLHCNDFGGTSSATPLAAGVGALMLSANPKLTRDQVRQILCDTADKIGTGYDQSGFSKQLGFGRVNAGKAVAAAKALGKAKAKTRR